MATGLRPGEWANATLRPATPADMTTEEDHRPWSVLTVQTSKRKGNFNLEFRTLLIREGLTRSLIIAHMETFKEAMQTDRTKSGRSLSTPGAERLIANCTVIIKQTSKRIWPDKSQFWATLYTLRSQARANFAAEFGTDLSAAMMGHSRDKSMRWYAPKSRANGHGGQILPGKDCVQRAAAQKAYPTRPNFAANGPRPTSEPSADQP